MQVGEVRELVIPAHEGAGFVRFFECRAGYGPRGFPAWKIPPGGTLHFTLECLAIK